MRTADIGSDDYCEVCNKSIRLHTKVKCELPVEEPKVEEVIEEVVVEAPEEELCEECGEDPCACEEEEEVDYSSMKVSELKQLLKIKGLKTTGNKADLIERLEG